MYEQYIEVNERLLIWEPERNEVDAPIGDAEQVRLQSGAEEIANSISHTIGLLAAIVGIPIPFKSMKKAVVKGPQLMSVAS